MTINASWLRMFVEMQQRHNLRGGNVLLTGQQDVMLSHTAAETLLMERGISFKSIPPQQRVYSASSHQRKFCRSPNHYLAARDLFTMLRFNSAVDIGETQWAAHAGLGKPVPDSEHNQYDFVIDVGGMNNVDDPFQAQENVANLVKPGGWILLNLPMAGSVVDGMYFANPPFYFDIFSANGMHNFDAWINWVPAKDRHNDVRTVWLNYKYNDDVYIWRPRYHTMMWFMAQKDRHVGNFQTVLQNFYQEWHAGKKLFQTTEDDLLRREAGLSELAVVSRRTSQRWGIGAEVLASLSGRRPDMHNSPWKYPTRRSRPTNEQLEQYPVNEMGVPSAAECLIGAADANSQIPEQMVVGTPPREQLYL